MHTTHRRVLALSTIALALASGAQAFQPLARGELFVQGDLRTEYDSNIYTNSAEVDDTILYFTPSLSFVRNAGIVRLQTSAGVEFQKFADNTKHDSSNGQFNASGSWAQQDGKSDGLVSIGVNRNSSANYYVNNLTTTDNYTFNAKVGHWATEKFGLRVTTEASQANSVKGGYSDISKLGAGFDGRMQYSPKLEALAGYSFRHSASDPTGNAAKLKSDDHRFSVGLDGELISKVKGLIRTGYVLRQLSGATSRNQSAPFIATSLDWQAREKSLLSFTLDRDFDTSSANQSVNKFNVGISLKQEITGKMTANVDVSYTHSGYTYGAARTDKLWSGRARLNYVFTDTISGYVYAGGNTSDSTSSAAKYDRFNLGFALAAKY